MEIRKTGGAKIAECLIYISSLVILSAILGSKHKQLKELLISREKWSWQRLCQIEILACFIFSWAFVALSTFIQYGIKAKVVAHPNAAIITVLLLLILSRLFSLLFLLECVYIVRNTLERKSTRPWIAGSCILFFGIPIACLLLVSKKVHCDTLVACRVGVANWASIPALLWYIGCSVYLAIAFVTPLLRSQFKDSPLRKHAFRTIACTTSAALWTICSAISLIIVRTVPPWLLLPICSADLTMTAMCFSSIFNIKHPSTSHSGPVQPGMLWATKSSPTDVSRQWSPPSLGYHFKSSPRPTQQQDSVIKREATSWRPIFNRRRASEGASVSTSPALQMEFFPPTTCDGKVDSFDTQANSMLSPVEEREDTLSLFEEGLGAGHPRGRIVL